MEKTSKAKLIIVANRLPVRAVLNDGEVSFAKSAGGLATGLDSLDINYEKHWIGWPGIYTEEKQEEAGISEKLEKVNFHPVFLSREDVELYYEGYSNSTLWPLFHYFYVYVSHDSAFWARYERVNLLFREKVKEVAGSNDIIWVHDYHLMLLPMMIRNVMPEVRIGFFLHIPFPSYELFRTLQNRGELLTGLMGSDLIGFHTFSYMRHFISTLYRIKGIESDDNTFHFENRTVSVDTFPMGINYKSFYGANKKPEVQDFAKRFREQYPGRKIVLSVDRLDYSKGILQRLECFRLLYRNHPEWIGKVLLIMILVPSRDSIERYQDLKEKIDEAIGNINGTYSKPGWIPIHYFYKCFSFDELTAFYLESDIALVTPLRDGMNLVAKEYVVAKANKPGVLILSEMAGAATELEEALVVNPNNTLELAETINRALLMPVKEQKKRLRKMQKILRKQDVVQWAHDFIDELERAHIRQEDILKKYLRRKNLREIAKQFRASGNRLIILDYDGTLVPFTNDPSQALPSLELKRLMSKLMKKKGLDMAVVSGRNMEFLQDVFSEEELLLFAEHGAYCRSQGQWNSLYRKDKSWQPEIVRIMQDVTDNTPGSMIERKDTTVVWHYRNADKWLAELRSAQLVNKLVYACTRRQLHLMRGNKIIEVKPSEYTKGTAIRNHFDFNSYDFIMAAGDDTTDEDMFSVLPRRAITIKIGKPSEKSKFTLASVADLIQFLKLFIR
jgi:trehalose 6-phosphate synthase/phosphatase